MKTLKALALLLPFFLVGAALAVAQDYRYGNIYSNGVLVNTQPNGIAFPGPNAQRMTYLSVTPASASTNSSNFTGVGDSTVANAAGSCGSGAGGKAAACTTGDTTTAQGWSTVSTDGYAMGANIFLMYRGVRTTLTNSRTWYALTNQTIATMCGSANPAGNYMGFRYDTGASDTHWQAITKDGTTQTIVDTGITPVSGTGQSFAIVQSVANSNVVFYINGAAVATINTHLPANLTALTFIAGLRSLSGTGQSIQGNYGYIFMDY